MSELKGRTCRRQHGAGVRASKTQTDLEGKVPTDPPVAFLAPRTRPRDAGSTKPASQKRPSLWRGRKARQLWVTSRARTLPRGSRVRGRSLPHRSAAADSCRPAHPTSATSPANPLLRGSARQTQSQACDKPLPIAQRDSASRSGSHPRGLHRDRGCLTRRKPFVHY